MLKRLPWIALRSIRATNYELIQISNSQASTFSRRKASEVCQFLANRARGWSGGRRQGTNGHPWRRE
jgi:hypothetical protein